MTTLLDYRNRCRICLKSNVGWTNVYNYTITGYQEPLAEIIFALFKIKWQRHSDLPSFMCRRCSIEMEQVLLLKEDIERNQIHLLQLLDNPNASFNYTLELKSELLESSQSNISSCEGIKSEPECKITTAEKGPKKHRRNHLQIDNSNSIRRSARNISKSATQNSSPSICVKKEISNGEVSVKKEELQNCSLPEDVKVKCPSTSLATISQTEDEIPQISFLQNFNLITLQDAEILRNQASIDRPRQRFIPKKFLGLNVPHMRKVNDKVFPKYLQKRRSSSKKSTTSKLDSDRLIVNRSINFLCRYGCRKLDNTQLKRGKVILKSEGCKSRLSKVSSKINKAVPKKSTGCENTNYLFNIKNKVQKVGNALKSINDPKIRDDKIRSKCLNPASVIIKRSSGRKRKSSKISLPDKEVKPELNHQFSLNTNQRSLLDTTNFYSQNNNRSITNKNFQSVSFSLVKTEFSKNIQLVDVTDDKELQLSFPKDVTKSANYNVKKIVSSKKGLALSKRVNQTRKVASRNGEKSMSNVQKS